MNIKSKKLVAREFMILILSLSLTLLTFLSIYAYNYFKREQIKPMISTKLKEYKMEVDEYNAEQSKRKNLYSSHVDKLDINYMQKAANNAMLGERIYEPASDSIRIYKRLLSEELISTKRQIYISKIALFSYLVALFLFRYFIYALVWSIKILKQS